MSTLSSNSSATLSNDNALRAASDQSDPAERVLYGLRVITWIKIGVIGVLMLALYRFNLARLWAKTNPINGQSNWEHAIFVPVIGLYYLYVWRDQLLSSPKPPYNDSVSEKWSMAEVWFYVAISPLAILMVLVPTVLASAFVGLNPALVRDSMPSLWSLLAMMLAYAGATVGLVYWKRVDLGYPTTQRWISGFAMGVRLWLMITIMLLGILFFVAGVILPSDMQAVRAGCRYLVAAISFGVLIIMFARASSPGWRIRCDQIVRNSSSWFGTYVMVWGILFSLWGVWPGQNDFFKDIGMVISVFGVVLLVSGWHVMRTAWFPIVFLFAAIPWPDQVYSWVSMPLQTFSAKVAFFVLNVSGVNTILTGTKFIMDIRGRDYALGVEEACSGLKSLMTFVSMAASIAFLSARPLWQKATLVLAAIPIAILCNAARVSGLGLLAAYVNEKWSQNFAHAFVGLLLLIPGLLGLLLVWWILDMLFIEEADPVTAKAATASATAAPAAPGKIVIPRRTAVSAGESQRDDQANNETANATATDQSDADPIPAVESAVAPAETPTVPAPKPPAKVVTPPRPAASKPIPRPALAPKSAGTASPAASAPTAKPAPAAPRPAAAKPAVAAPSTAVPAKAPTAARAVPAKPAAAAAAKPAAPKPAAEPQSELGTNSKEKP